MTAPYCQEADALPSRRSASAANFDIVIEVGTN